MAPHTAIDTIAPILIADDSATICMTLCAVLQPLHRSVLVAPSGMAAVRLAMQHRPVVCIVDYDLALGDVKGDAVARTLVGQGVTVLLYSSLEEKRLERLAQSIGCACHCKVGTTLTELREHVRTLIDKGASHAPCR